MKEHCVYLLIFPSNKIYVGRSSQLAKRISVHRQQMCGGYHHNVLVQEEWNRVGEFNVTKINVSTEELAIYWEKTLIDKFRSLGCALNIGPATNGGDAISHHPRADELKAACKSRLLTWTENYGKECRPDVSGERNPMWGKTHTEDARRKMSEANLGITRRSGFKLSEHRRKMMSEFAATRTGEKNSFYGRTHSEETKKKLSQAHKGRITGQGFQIEIDGVEYASYWHAARELQIPLVTIRWRVLSKNKRFENYKLLDR